MDTQQIQLITQKKKIIRALERLAERLESENANEHATDVDDLNTIISWIEEEL